jgi:hypothetical protein
MTADDPVVSSAQITTVDVSRLQRDGLYGFLTVAFAAALCSGLIRERGAVAKVTITVIFGALTLAVAVTWVKAWRHPDRLDVGADRIRLRPSRGQASELVRADSGQLRCFVRAAGRTRTLELQQLATGRRLALPFFSPRAVAEACRSAGWEVSTSPARRLPF